MAKLNCLSEKKLGFVFGTRPEIIKLSPIIKLCQKIKIPFFCIHTGQHYSHEMDKIFFKDLNLPLPKYRLQIKSSAPFKQGEHTGRMLIELEKILLKEMPYCILIQGDTNTVLAAALTAEKISTTESYTGFHIRIAHVEAGLRSYDRSMPEETNRFITDHLSDFLFTPTNNEKEILLREGVDKSKIFTVGNTIVDSVKNNIKSALLKSEILKTLGLKRHKYLLTTIHRQENVDSKEIFSNILSGLEKVNDSLKLPMIFPIHPRTAKMMDKFNLSLPKSITPIAPVGFMDFLLLESNAALILTDSGGIQEEACILKVPCVTLRSNTERPKTVKVKANMISYNKPDRILSYALKMINARRKWKNPFGDGKTSQRIIEAILN
ncbi:MAG: UDP-N-acetylglucosamine 2-epimerase (non-hydrolyzing) [Patescibacteria group bacterium]